MLKEDEQTEFKKTTRELNEAMISISAILNKHKHGVIFFGLKMMELHVHSQSPTLPCVMFLERSSNQ